LPPVLLAALTSAQKAGLAGMGAAFIIFALVSSFVLPRRWPNFPGRHLWAYVAVCACFFAAMMLAVVFIAREQPEASAEPQTPTLPSPAPSPSPAPAPAPAPTGDATAGKVVFTANGCAACHTFKPAGVSGTIGPDLDNLAADAKTANRGSLDQYATESIVDPNAYIVPKFPGSVMPPDFGSKLSKTQVADLVAFLTQPG
jgi:mono/diheme cytochrome c family protein